MLGHEAYILQNLLTYFAHISFPEAQKLVVLADLLKVQILKTVLHSERHVYFAINNATFEIKLTDLLFDLQEKVSHQQDVYLFDILHLNSVDAVDLRDEALRVFPEVVQVRWQSILHYFLLASVHCFDQEPLIEG